MSHDDDNRPRDRGAYTPPTDDDLPFNRSSFDARRGPTAKAPPVTLIVSAGVLLVLIVIVVLFYRSGLRSSTDAPPAIGTPVTQMKVEASADAQPVDAEAGVGLYDEAEGTATAPAFVPPPEAPQPRPAAPATAAVPAATRPTTSAPTRPPVEAPAATANGTGGAAAVQIGAFSTTAIADREYAAIAARFPQFARNATKRVQQVTASNGSTVYRTTFTGLSREDARSFCAAIEAGGGDCLVR